MRMFAEFTVHEIERELTAKKIRQAKLAIINKVIKEKRLLTEYQPVFSLLDNRHVGFECLARFKSEQSRLPNFWFKDAEDVGVGAWLQIEAVKKAVEPLLQFQSQLFLSINASPQTIQSPRFDDLIQTMPQNRIVIEIDEPSRSKDEASFNSSLQRFKQYGARLAVDITGCDGPSLQQILNLQPNIIKLDVNLLRAMERDPTTSASGPALIDFTRETKCEIVVKGEVTAGDIAILPKVCAPSNQCYYLGHPLDLKDAIEL